jgi:hypothetical protein
LQVVVVVDMMDIVLQEVLVEVVLVDTEQVQYQ